MEDSNINKEEALQFITNLFESNRQLSAENAALKSKISFMYKIPYWELVETLLDVINQSCTFTNGFLSHSFMSAYEHAFEVLENLGVLEECTGREDYKLLWDKLKR